MNYVQFNFENRNESEQEILIALLSDFPFEGFEQELNKLSALIKENNLNLELMDFITSLNFSSKEIIEEINWNEKWEKEYEPIIINNKLAIRATFHKPIKGVEKEIVITPQMSFGTGHHATTQLMLSQMSKIDFTNKAVFDYGTGTGVLAIYAEMLGAKEILAVDIDEWSYKNAQENVERNECTRITLHQSDLEIMQEQQFDIILANINLHILSNRMKDLFNMLLPQGILLLSGILKDDKTKITEIVKPYLNEIQVFELNSWLALVAKN